MDPELLFPRRHLNLLKGRHFPGSMRSGYCVLLHRAPTSGVDRRRELLRIAYAAVGAHKILRVFHDGGAYQGRRDSQQTLWDNILQKPAYAYIARSPILAEASIASLLMMQEIDGDYHFWLNYE